MYLSTYLNDKIKGDYMAGCVTSRVQRKQMDTIIQSEGLKGRYYFGDVGIDVRMFKMDLKTKGDDLV
jgi:hypothetical protein